nr:hypothetical protein Iba_chr04eCG18930 [Ipomoea batatas]
MESACAEEVGKEPACVEGADIEPANTGDDGTEARCDVRGLKAGPDDERAASDPTVVTSKADRGCCCTGTGAAIVVTAKHHYRHPAGICLRGGRSARNLLALRCRTWNQVHKLNALPPPFPPNTATSTDGDTCSDHDGS